MRGDNILVQQRSSVVTPGQARNTARCCRVPAGAGYQRYGMVTRAPGLDQALRRCLWPGRGAFS